MSSISPKRVRRAELYVIASVVVFIAAIAGVSAFVGGERLSCGTFAPLARVSSAVCLRCRW